MPECGGTGGRQDKVAAIKGAMQGGYIDVLITDFPTARMLIAD